MPFTPAAGVLNDMTIDVTQLQGGDVRLDVTVRDGSAGAAAAGAAGAAGRTFTRSLTCRADDIGPVRRVALERNGRTGGAALFGKFSIRALSPEP